MDIESQLAALPSDPGLQGPAADSYQRERHRLSQHHRLWRANRSAIDHLFEDDQHRAKGLAANLATELEQVMGLLGTTWGSASEPISKARLERNLKTMAAEWTSVVSALRDAQSWDRDSIAVFDDFLAQLLDRGQRRAHDTYVAACEARRSPSRWWLPASIGGLVRRLFHPGS